MTPRVISPHASLRSDTLLSVFAETRQILPIGFGHTDGLWSLAMGFAPDTLSYLRRLTERHD